MISHATGEIFCLYSAENYPQQIKLSHNYFSRHFHKENLFQFLLLLYFMQKLVISVSLCGFKFFPNLIIHYSLFIFLLGICAKPFWLPIELCEKIARAKISKKNRNGFWRLQKLWLATNPTILN